MLPFYQVFFVHEILIVKDDELDIKYENKVMYLNKVS